MAKDLRKCHFVVKNRLVAVNIVASGQRHTTIPAYIPHLAFHTQSQQSDHGGESHTRLI